MQTGWQPGLWFVALVAPVLLFVVPGWVLLRFGFHSHVAALIWLTGMDAPQAVLIGGQLANAAAVLTLYPLALRLGHNQWAGVAAWLIAGLLLSMPMLYVNWGRYPQLDGQAILPVAIALLWYYLAAPQPARALFVLTACTMAGLVLTHYRVAIFAACFLSAYLVVMGGKVPGVR